MTPQSPRSSAFMDWSRSTISAQSTLFVKVCIQIQKISRSKHLLWSQSLRAGFSRPPDALTCSMFRVLPDPKLHLVSGSS